VIGRGATMEDAVAAPRLHTEGDLTLTLEPGWSEQDTEYFKKLGYTMRTGSHAIVHAASRDPKTGACRTASR
jgi:gamma-glutamyltranspeptidase / glutathione hydrolase